MIRSPLKPKTCKGCGGWFQPNRRFEAVCSPRCALYVTRQKAEAEQRKKDKARLRELRPRRYYMKLAQAAFNAWVKLRDANLPCVSCGRHHQGQYHAGHFLSVGSHPELRFEPLNVWKQCQPCNTHLSGNQNNYRKALVQRIGVEKVEWLEGPHHPCKFDIPALQEIAARYNRLARELAKPMREAA